ncbi:DUF4148 domain-containing protein [Caballeronia insecticola]|uniref:DUF4148 domain-containing protein n=1 Tax=Caballeronia insecticola TaxID=758793 RepID=UPI000A06244C|nr:DUF4148 domain-containing protein [Caballeronia insecticola]
MLKSITATLVFASAAIAPTLAHADEASGLTRAEVKAELVQLEQAGYNPSSDHATYPSNILAAQERLRTQREEAGATAVGGVSGDTSSSGRAITPSPLNVSRP